MSVLVKWGVLSAGSQMVGFLNVEIWIGVEGILVDDLRLDKKFPDSPVVG